MDHLTEGFGRLSTTAREWTPSSTSGGGAATAAANMVSSSSLSISSSSSSVIQTKSDRSGSIDSELNAASVKEFVPGQGWNTTTSSTPTTSTSSTTTHSSNSNNNNIGGGGAAVNYYEQAQLRQQQQQQQHQEEEEEQDPSQQEAVLPAGPICPSSFRSLHTLGMSDDLWQFYREVSLQSLKQMPPTDPRHKTVPLPYVNAYCLKDARSKTFGFLSKTFQVTNRNDGHLYLLRRYEGVTKHLIPPPQAVAKLLDDWSSIEHPNLVPLRNCFLGPHRAMFFVHNFVPNACSVKDFLMNNPITERVLWSALCQLVAVLRRTHSTNASQTNNINKSNNNNNKKLGLAKCLTLRHVLIQTNMTKITFFVSACGIADVLYDAATPNNNNNQNNRNNHNPNSNPTHAEDIRQLGRLILSMASGGGTELTTTTNISDSSFQRCETICLQTYSREFHNLVMTLIRSPQAPTVVDVSRALAGRVWDEWDHVQLTLDRTERALCAEYESGRALRLLLKLGFINERPEFGPNRRWQQSGDCYLLTLFRDYVFHQADGAGNPIMDLGHVITTLNKLDAAEDEQIVLTSRDGKSLMVVTYADVARCLDSAYHELCSGSVPPPNSVAAAHAVQVGIGQHHHRPPPLPLHQPPPGQFHPHMAPHPHHPMHPPPPHPY